MHIARLSHIPLNVSRSFPLHSLNVFILSLCQGLGFTRLRPQKYRAVLASIRHKFMGASSGTIKILVEEPLALRESMALGTLSAISAMASTASSILLLIIHFTPTRYKAIFSAQQANAFKGLCPEYLKLAKLSVPFNKFLEGHEIEQHAHPCSLKYLPLGASWRALKSAQRSNPSANPYAHAHSVNVDELHALRLFPQVRE